MKYVVFLLSLLLPYAATAKMMDVAYFKLENGLEVAVVENHKAPVVLHMLYYKTGSLNDPTGKGGLAHLLEHMMFRGTKSVSGEEFDALMTRYGAQNNAYTTYDETVYHEFSDISKLELMMALEADRMQHLNMDDADFLKERDVVMQERFQRFETKPTPLFYEMMNKILWQNHPRANPVSGSVAEIKQLTKEDAVQFYQRWYRPDNALLVLAGDITADTGYQLAQKYYGKIKGREKEFIDNTVNEPRKADTTVVMALDGVEQPRYVSYLRLERGQLEDNDLAALAIWEEYMSGDDTSYLSEKLVYGSKQFLSVGAGVDYDDKYGGSLTFYAVPADDSLSAAEITAIFDKEAEQAINELTAEKVEKIKNQVLSSVIYLQENPQSAAQFVGGMLMSGYTADEISRYDETLKKVSLEGIRQAWQKVKAYKVRLNGYLKGKNKEPTATEKEQL